ncbi:MAG TPA: hypothetical protein PK344_17605 [Syntrophorhabdaceae bacterium]|nr:hypothetical protein [Syntrophorhabdaceae bacterium]
MEKIQMVTRIENPLQGTREWTLNERVNGNVFGRVRISESPLRIKLFWKLNDDPTTKQFVGLYDLNLNDLVNAGYVRDLNNSQGEVLLRFQSNNLLIEIAMSRTAPALLIGNII